MAARVVDGAGEGGEKRGGGVSEYGRRRLVPPYLSWPSATFALLHAPILASLRMYSNFALSATTLSTLTYITFIHPSWWA